MNPWSQWQQWQRAVVELLRNEAEELARVRIEDIDWPSWEHFFHEGKSPQAAIDRALERDL